MQLWLEQLPLHTFEMRTENRHMRIDVTDTNSSGLATIQAVTELVEKEEQTVTDSNGEKPHDNLATLTNDIQAIGSEKK